MAEHASPIPRIRYSRHILYNLTRPEQSLLLLAPLAKEAGGYGICGTGINQSAVFPDPNNPDYQALLASVHEAKNALNQMKRFDMPGFHPGPEYIRELKRFGILSADFPADGEIDCYATDREYWTSLWHR